MKRLVLIFSIFVVIFGCGKKEESKKVSVEAIVEMGRRSQNKVFILGLDGATFNLIVPMMRRGELPNIEKLLREGAYGNLTSIEPMSSPVLWTTIFTGKKREVHGITDYTITVEGETKPIPVGSRQRRVLALWNMATVGGKTGAFFAFWATHPAESVSGFIISDRYDEEGIENAFYPPEFEEEVERYISVSDDEIAEITLRFTDFEYEEDFTDKYKPGTDIFEKNKAVAILRYHLRRDIAMMRASRYVLKMYAPDIVSCYIKGTDGVSHIFWKYMDPYTPYARYDDITGEDREHFGGVIEEYYRFCDEMLGELMPFLDDYHILIVSDHGFGPVPDEINYNMKSLLTEMGLARYEKGELVEGKSTVYVMQSDWSNRRSLRLNLKGRERGGMVDENDADAVLKKVCEALRSIKTKSGKLLFVNVENKGVQGANKAEIEVEFNKDIKGSDTLMIDGREVGADTVLVSRGISGDHMPNGVIILSGDSIKKCIIGEANIIDITPTVLALLGLPVAKDMQGKVLKSIFTEEFLSRCPIETIDTYEGLAPKMVSTPQPLPSDKEKREELRGLGYIQ